VGVAAPASSAPESELDAALAQLRRLGLRPELCQTQAEPQLYLSRPDAVRAAELTELFLDARVRAIFCACPGYGSLRLLPLLPWPEIRRHPKILMGYSDITALLNAVLSRCGFVTFHGPTLVPGLLPEALSPLALRSLRRALFGGTAPSRCRCPRADVLGHGTVTGRLVGGNLEMLTSLVGTPWEPATAGAILVLEEVGEGEETLDQRLTHLRLSGKFDGVQGVVFGDMSRNEISAPYRVTDVIRNVLGDLDLPILIGLPAGHGTENLPLVLGARYSLSVTSRTLTQLDPGVVAA
jgi:muramoyltetrapeptide carboxypeptidase